MSVLRITNLLQILAQGPSTARELADALNVSPRTVARDIRMLQAAGVPVYTQPGRDGGVVLQMEDAAMESCSLLSLEFRQLLAETAASELDASSAASRIGRYFTQTTAAPSPMGHLFSQLKKLILEYKSVRMKYVNGRGRIRRGRLRPEILVWHNDAWSLLASTSVNGLNAYIPLNRLLTIDTDSAWTRQSSVLPRSAPCRRIRFLVPLSAAFGLEHLFPRVRLRSTPDGNIEIRIMSVRDVMCVGLLMTALVPVCLCGPPRLCERAEADIYQLFDIMCGRRGCPSKSRCHAGRSVKEPSESTDV